VLLATVLLLALAAAACSDDGSDGDDDAAPVEESTTTSAPSDVAPLPDEIIDYASEQYADGQNWLCHPDDADENVCDRDLTTTVVAADGTAEIVEHEAAEDPPVDCFYIYPTISADPELNSDLEPADGQEIRAAVNQVARLSSVCEVYAPVYRQMTLASLTQRLSGTAEDADMEAAREMTYGDVRDAFFHYLANDNDGRGVIVVGHSQGAGLLTELIAEEVAGNEALTDRLVAAYLLGTTLPVPDAGEGEPFDGIPLCQAPDDIGCVVSYVSYAASEPPGADALFGLTQDAGTVAACTNPAALSGPAALDGANALVPYFSAEEGAALAPNTAVTTPWVSVTGVLTGVCEMRGDRHVLEVTLLGDPTDERDRLLGGGLPATWGLHLADANLAMGNLEALAAAQAASYTDG
jgi:hypothetical protein